MRILAIGGPKGGKGASTMTLTLAAVFATWGRRVLVIDCDANQSVADVADAAEAAHRPLLFDVADGRNPGVLRKLRAARLDYDVVIVDLPGAREAGVFDAILRGADGRPVPDLLVMPTAPEAMDLRPTLRVLLGEVIPLGLAHLIVFTRVDASTLPRARLDQKQLRDTRRPDGELVGVLVADTIIRRYQAFNEATRQGCTVLDLPGVGYRCGARLAEYDFRALAREVADALGIEAPVAGARRVAL